MKTKKINKKLSLNKKTVANLDSGAMNAIYAGYHPPTYLITCPQGCNTEVSCLFTMCPTDVTGYQDTCIPCITETCISC